MKLKYKILITTLVLFVFFINLSGIIKSVIYYESVRKYSEMYGVDHRLVLSIIYAESSFIPHAKSHKGAMGLMQILPTTFKDLRSELNLGDDITLLKKPDVNIRVGVYYLSILKKQKMITDVELLSAYNAGKTKTIAWKKKASDDLKIDDIPYNETRNYIKKVTRIYAWLKRII